MADKQDLRVQEQLNRTCPDLSILSDERLVGMPPSHSIVNAGISFVAVWNLKRFNLTKRKNYHCSVILYDSY